MWRGRLLDRPDVQYMQDCEGQHLLYPGRNNMQIAKCQVLCTTSALRGRRGLIYSIRKGRKHEPKISILTEG